MKEIKFVLEYNEETGKFFHNANRHDLENKHGFKTVAYQVTSREYNHFINFLGFDCKVSTFGYSFKYVLQQWGRYVEMKKLLSERDYKIQKKRNKKSKMDGLLDKLKQRTSESYLINLMKRLEEDEQANTRTTT